MVIKRWLGRAKIREGYNMATISFTSDIKFNKRDTNRFFEIIDNQNKNNSKDISTNLDTIAKINRGKELLNSLFSD